MRWSSNWSGPSNTGSARVNSASPTGTATASATSIEMGSTPSARVIGVLQGRQQLRIGFVHTADDEGSDPPPAARGRSEVGRQATVVQIEVKRVAP